MNLYEIINDDDQEIVNLMDYQRHVYTIHLRVNHMTIWDDQDFRAKFKISKDVVFLVLGFINNQISLQSGR